METVRLQGLQLPIRIISPTDLAEYPVGALITADSTIVVPGQADVVPDLAPFAPSDLQLVKRNGRLLVLFTTTFWNRGKGPLELDATSTKPVADNVYETAQHIVLSNGSVRNKVVGDFFWDAAHKHFHYNDFASYILTQMVTSQGEAQTFVTPPPSTVVPAPPIWTPGLVPSLPKGTVLGASTVAPQVVNKSTFCLYENQHIPLPTDGVSKPTKSYTICGRYKQGVSVGWADVYPYTLVDQNFDVTDLPAGIYSISFVVDPHQHLMEENTDNNIGVTFFQLDPVAGTMTVLASGAPFATPENQYPDGMLVRSENDPAIYVMQNNKRLPVTTQTTGQVYILPQGVFDAIPPSSLIQAMGSTTIYVLNDKGFRRGITNMDVFNSYGFKLQDVTEISPSDLANYPETDLIQKQGGNTVYSISTHQSVGTVESLPAQLNPASVHVVNQTDFESYNG